jgi:hypothetical protein
MRRRRERNVLDPQIRDLLDPRAGVIEQQQQRTVPKGLASLRRQVCEERLDLVAIHEAHLGQGRPLCRNRRDPLARASHRTAGPVVARAAAGATRVAGSPSTTTTVWVAPSSASGIASGSTATPSSSADLTPDDRWSGF